MADKFKLNPITGELDLTYTIPELSSDPGSPAAADAWVLRSGGSSTNPGDAMGLLLALTYAGGGGGGSSYQFSYKTLSDGIKRVTIS